MSVVIPCYNGAAFIRQALESVLEQTYPNIEIIVVDDGSTDGSAAIVRRVAPQARIIIQPNRGEGASRNRGILAAAGEYVALLDADDWWEKELVARQVEVFLDHPETGCVYSDFAHSIDGESQGSRHARLAPRPEGQVYQRLAEGNFVSASAIMIRRSAFSVAGLFDPKLKSAADYDMWLRLAKTEEFRSVRCVLSYYRIHGNNSVVSGRHAVNALRGFEALAEHHKSNPAIYRILKRRVGKRAFEFAYAESRGGEHRAAAGAYLKSLWQGYRPFRSAASAGVSLCRAGLGLLSGLRWTKKSESASPASAVAVRAA